MIQPPKTPAANAVTSSSPSGARATPSCVNVAGTLLRIFTSPAGNILSRRTRYTKKPVKPKRYVSYP